MNAKPVIQKINRPEIESSSLFGFVVKESSLLTMVLKEYDFMLDGFLVVRNCDIDKCKANPSTRHGTRIMKNEGLLGDIESIPNVDISDWPSLLKSLKNLDEYVIIEDETDDQFLIGPIKRINKNSVSIKFFTGTGKWDEYRNIKYDEITMIQFDTRYLNLHRKYIKKR